MKTFRNHGLVAALALGSFTLAAHAAPWTSIGSAGVVDEADLGIFEFINGEAHVTGGAVAGSILNLRYNLVALEDFVGLNQVVWTVRFTDNGAGARVRLFLRQYNATGPTSTLATFDSNAYPSAVGYQTRNACIGVDWDFINGPFFIEAELSKSGATGTPRLGLTILNNESCTP